MAAINEGENSSCTDLLSGDAGLALAPHAERNAVLSELHARPFEAVTSPCRAIRFAFLTDAAQMNANAEALTR
ncbi:DUF3422 family protein, partial [Serratia marcescens]|uniref:DUF3422 family protein n=1 Tax=Serratia marcescens TaxID=615 RepID=UPI001953B6CB